MRGFRRDLTTPRDLQHNQKVIEEHVNDLHYVWRIGPQDFGYLDGATLTRIGSNVMHSAIAFADGATTQAYAERHRPAYWISGVVRVTVYYTGDTASTNNAGIAGRLSAVGQNGNLNVAGSPFALALAPGPAVIGDEKSVVLSPTMPVDAYHRHIALKITRVGLDAADTYAGRFLLTQVVAEFLPLGQQL